MKESAPNLNDLKKQAILTINKESEKKILTTLPEIKNNIQIVDDIYAANKSRNKKIDRVE